MLVSFVGHPTRHGHEARLWQSSIASTVHQVARLKVRVRPNPALTG